MDIDDASFKDGIDVAHGAHGAAHGTGVFPGGYRLAPVAPCFFRIDGKREHGFPVEVAPRLAHTVVFFACTRNALGDIRGMCGNPACHDAFTDILQGRQAEVFGRGYVTEKGRSRRGRHGAADRRGDVVIPRRDVGNDGAEHVKGRIVAEAPLELLSKKKIYLR